MEKLFGKCILKVGVAGWFCGDRNEGESVRAQESVGERVAHQSKHPGAGSTKSIKALIRRISQGETGKWYEQDRRHVDVLGESLGLENGNTVQTPIIDDVKDETPLWLDSEQISK